MAVKTVSLLIYLGGTKGGAPSFLSKYKFRNTTKTSQPQLAQLWFYFNCLNILGVNYNHSLLVSFSHSWLFLIAAKYLPPQHLQVKHFSQVHVWERFRQPNLFQLVVSYLITGNVLGLPISNWPAQQKSCFRALLSVKSLMTVWVLGGTAITLGSFI